MKEDLRNLEREVETARARLNNRLSTLSSRDTYAAFKEEVKDQARSALSRMVENVKGRAAANPAAALAIGAGLTWRLIHRPPVAAALIGAGIFSLFRTTPVIMNGNSQRDYYSEGKTRLKQQAGVLADAVKDQTVEIANEIKEQASDLAVIASDKVGEAVESMKEQAATLSHRASQIADDGWRSATAIRQSATRNARVALNDADVRDNLLLGLAGVAVMAALGVAYQRGGQNEPGA